MRKSIFPSEKLKKSSFAYYDIALKMAYRIIRESAVNLRVREIHSISFRSTDIPFYLIRNSLRTRSTMTTESIRQYFVVKSTLNCIYLDIIHLMDQGSLGS